jgi:hypothetical protein
MTEKTKGKADQKEPMVEVIVREDIHCPACTECEIDHEVYELDKITFCSTINCECCGYESGIMQGKIGDADFWISIMRSKISIDLALHYGDIDQERLEKLYTNQCNPDTEIEPMKIVLLVKYLEEVCNYTVENYADREN